MNVPEIMIDLPEDTHDAVEIILDRLRKSKQGSPAAFDFSLAAKLLVRVAEEFTDLKLELRPSNTRETDYYKFMEVLDAHVKERKMHNYLDTIVSRRKNREVMYGAVRLTSDDKDVIRKKIQSIRKYIDGVSLPDRKKNAIRKRLVDLEKEIDYDGTFLDNTLALIVDVTFAGKSAHKNLEPAIKDAKDIASIFTGRRMQEEQISLPTEEQNGLIEPPTAETEA